MIDSFKGEHAFLSNFFPSPIEWEGATWPTVEHAFQAAKAVRPEEREAIRTSLTPGIAKRRGRAVTLRKDWEDVKLVVIEVLLRLKFAPGSDLAARLVATGDQALIEGNNWGDRFWGKVGSHGSNHLGRLLMEIRTDLAQGA